MFAAYPVPSASALVAPQRPKSRSRYPFGNSCNDIRRQKSVLRRPSSVLCRISNHPRSSSDPPQFNKPGYVGPVGTTNEYKIGTDDALERTGPGRASSLVWSLDAGARMAQAVGVLEVWQPECRYGGHRKRAAAA